MRAMTVCRSGPFRALRGALSPQLMRLRPKSALATETELPSFSGGAWMSRPSTPAQDAPQGFDFMRHVCLSDADLANIQMHKLSDMGYEVHPGEADFAYCEPFRLLSEEGLKAYRDALLSRPVLENCYYSCDMVPLTIRNSAQHNQFIREMSNSEEMLKAVGKAVGMELVWHPFNVEHMMTNIQMKGKEATKVFDWHNDSNCFVLLVNLSEIPEDVQGGGTLMKDHRTGESKEIRAPKPGWAYIMQGKRVLHAANASQNWTRVVSVISFCGKATLAPESLEEDSVDLFLARNYTDHALLDKEYVSYRLSRCMDKLRFLQDRYLDETANNFSSHQRRGELRRHLDHLAKNLSITSSSLQLLNDFSEGSPAPLPAESVPALEIAKLAFGRGGE